MNDLAIVLCDDGRKHLYEQIYEYIRDEIKAGKLLEGERLPSTRYLAEYLKVARSTVDLAYEQLISEGYIEAVPYRGYYICRVEELYRIMDAAEGEPEREPQPEKTAYDIDFSPNAIDMGCFPFGTWRRISREVLSEDRRELFALGAPQGDEAFRGTILKYLHASRGVNAKPEQIVIGAGNDYLLLLLQFLLKKPIRIAFEEATYPRAYRIFRSFSREVVTIPMDESGIRVDCLEETGVDAAYVMPSHQYPTGMVMPIGRRIELLKWAAAGGERYLIEDDYDSEFRYRGKPIPSLQASDTAGKVIYIGTFSKSAAPAIRVSYMVLPPKLLERYRTACGFFSSTVSRIDQTVLNEFIRCGAFERHLNKMRKVYKEKHDVLLEEIKPLLTRYSLSGEHTGLHILLTSRQPAEESRLLQLAASAGVKLYGMEDAFVEKAERSGAATLLIGFAGLSEADIREGIRRLNRVL